MNKLWNLRCAAPERWKSSCWFDDRACQRDSSKSEGNDIDLNLRKQFGDNWCGGFELFCSMRLTCSKQRHHCFVILG